jgi:hypothetical protein
MVRNPISSILTGLTSGNFPIRYGVSDVLMLGIIQVHYELPK